MGRHALTHKGSADLGINGWFEVVSKDEGFYNFGAAAEAGVTPKRRCVAFQQRARPLFSV